MTATRRVPAIGSVLLGASQAAVLRTSPGRPRMTTSQAIDGEASAANTKTCELDHRRLGRTRDDRKETRRCGIVVMNVQLQWRIVQWTHTPAA